HLLLSYRLHLRRLLSFFLIRRPPRPPLFPYTTLFRSVPAEVGREVVVRVRGGPARGGDPLAIRRVRDLRRHELARVAGRRLRLSDRPLDVDPRREGEVDVRFAVGDVLRSRLEPRARRVRELALGPQTVEEEGEHALERRVQVGVRLALPLRARLHELAAAQRREHRV